MTNFKIFNSLSRDFSNPKISLLYIIVFLSFPLGFLLTCAHGDNSSEAGSNLPGFNFVVAGDFGCGDEAKKNLDAMANMKPELVLALGDLAYTKNPICWFDMIKPLENISKFKISIGEHDISRGNAAYDQYLKHFSLTKPYYSFDYKNIHFLAMATAKNTLIPYTVNSTQYQFVKNDLKSAHENKSINWIIVYTFRPFYSSNTTHPGEEEMRDAYHPLFDETGVDLVLQAHNHNYQRTYPISYNVTKPSTPVITNTNTENYTNIENGQIFITLGTGGANFYNFTAQKPFIVKQLLLHGFLNVDVANNGSKLWITFFENTGMGRDHITISKAKG